MAALVIDSTDSQAQAAGGARDDVGGVGDVGEVGVGAGQREAREIRQGREVGRRGCVHGRGDSVGGRRPHRDGGVLWVGGWVGGWSVVIVG